MAESCENFVLIINCSKLFSPEEFVTQITKENFSTQKLSNGWSYHPWRIENKYYCADVKLMVANHEEKPDWLPRKELEITAIVIAFDQVQSSFEEAKEWLPIVETQDASVLLLVGSKSQQTSSDEMNDTSSLTSEVLKFAIKHSFEFVDLNEEVDPEDDFPDTVGFARIVQALQATEWPCLQMKGETTTSSENDSVVNEAKKSNEEVDSEKDFDTLHDAFDGIMEDADLEGEPSFDKLFSQMKLMKDKAESLPHSERKAYAEQVAVAFWKAMGGDEDEIEGLGIDEK